MDQDSQQPKIPGITLRSLSACLFGLLLMGMYVQYAEIMQVSAGAIGEQVLPVPGMSVFLFVLVLGGISHLLVGKRLLNRQEQFCVLFALLIAAPMMTQGMWHRFIGILAATPRDQNFHYMDAFNDKLWPHGPNLIEELKGEVPYTSRGNKPQTRELEIEPGKTTSMPVLVNKAASDESAISYILPVKQDGKLFAVPGEPVLLSFLAKPMDLDADTFYFVRLYFDDSEIYSEIINTRTPSAKTFLHQTGFVRTGKYAVKIPTTVKHHVRYEIGLSGTGELAIADPKFFSVSALEGVYIGRKMISQADYESLPELERSGLIVKPDNMWSPAGAKFLITGYIPVADWTTTAIAWGTPIAILLLSLFAMGVIMRKQWADSERYTFPIFQIPYALNGEADEEEGAFAKIWHSRWMRWGFVIGLSIALLRGWDFYSSDVEIKWELPLSDFISGGSWGDMWKVSFTVSLLVLSVAIFFELNVLISLVIGFFLFRSMHWMGEVSGLKVYSGYPFRYEQAVGAYLGYALMVVFFTRKYLWKVLQDACVRNREASEGEALTYRTALLIIVGSFVGIALWALWLDVPMTSVLLYYFFLLTIGLVAAKFRCECGVPTGYFTPYNAMLFVTLLGGMTVFGPKGVLVCLIASGFLTVSVFFFIPGAQVEMLEYGRRYRIVPRHLIYTCIIGILGGLFIGGWVFLSNSYAIGGDNIKYQWAYSQGWYFRPYMTQLSTTTGEWLREGATVDAPMAPATWAYIIAGGLTMVITTLRQLFAGFWFHPIGLVLGSAHMMEWAWGSCLAAWVIRGVTLMLGGAATIRTKLFPFFIGIFLGCIVSCFVFVMYGYYLQSMGIDTIYSGLP